MKFKVVICQKDISERNPHACLYEHILEREMIDRNYPITLQMYALGWPWPWSTCIPTIYFYWWMKESTFIINDIRSTLLLLFLQCCLVFFLWLVWGRGFILFFISLGGVSINQMYLSPLVLTLTSRQRSAGPMSPLSCSSGSSFPPVLSGIKSLWTSITWEMGHHDHLLRAKCLH